MSTRRVLVTGLSGLIGSAFRKHVRDAYVLRALNRRAVPGVETHRADLGDLAAIQPAFEKIDTVVHLAAAAGDHQAADDIMRSNVVGAYHVFEAARAAGVQRVIFASSGATVSGWEREPPLNDLVAGRYEQAGTIAPLTHETPVRPSGLYGASKVWGEALGRHYADAYGMSVICLRIGRVKAEDRPTTTRDAGLRAVQCLRHAVRGVVAQARARHDERPGAERLDRRVLTRI